MAPQNRTSTGWSGRFNEPFARARRIGCAWQVHRRGDHEGRASSETERRSRQCVRAPRREIGGPRTAMNGATAELVERLLGGDRIALAKLMTLVENRDSEATEVMS